MSGFKDGVYWVEQCDYCKDNAMCKYQRDVRFSIKRLQVAEFDSKGCYGTLSFWCDYFRVDSDKVKARQVNEVQA